MDQEIHIELAKLCLKNNITYSASIWDETIIDWIDPYLSFYKVGSGDLTAYPLLEKIAQKQKPIVLSTGLSSLEEILDAVKYIESINSFADASTAPSSLAIATSAITPIGTT